MRFDVGGGGGNNGGVSYEVELQAAEKVGPLFSAVLFNIFQFLRLK